ncbi:MAG: virulence factor [Acidobacteriota bacterium]|nr:virulence factor [Acidobacteriota bacterium]
MGVSPWDRDVEREQAGIMAQYQILFWKDIPAQIKVYQGRRGVSRPLPDRFQVEIDRVAMAEGLAGTDDYLDQWHWSAKQERSGTTQEVLDSLAEELEREFDARKRRGAGRSGKSGEDSAR